MEIAIEEKRGPMDIKRTALRSRPGSVARGIIEFTFLREQRELAPVAGDRATGAEKAPAGNGTTTSTDPVR